MSKYPTSSKHEREEQKHKDEEEQRGQRGRHHLRKAKATKSSRFPLSGVRERVREGQKTKPTRRRNEVPRSRNGLLLSSKGKDDQIVEISVAIPNIQ